MSMEIKRSTGSRGVESSRQPAAPPKPAEAARPVDVKDRSMFEARPQVEKLTLKEGGPNTTWEQMTQSLGEAHDMRRAGRTLDTNLLYELSRYEKGPMPERLAIAELAGMGIIHSKAFEQITNNTNFGGWKMPVEDRLAFALAVQHGGGQQALDGYFGARPYEGEVKPFEQLGKVTQKGTEWVESFRAPAKALLEAAEKNELLSSPAYGKLLSAEVGGGANSPKGLLALKAAKGSGADAAQAKALADRAEKGELDVVTLMKLSPGAAWNGKLVFNEQFGSYAVAPKVTLEVAARIAGDVAKGELSLGQIHGFMMKFGAADDRGEAMMELPFATELIKSVNRGEVSESALERVLDPKEYFPGALANRVWDHFFSGKAENGGNKYTYDGAAPQSTYTASLIRMMTPDSVRALANDEGKRTAFTASFAKHVSEALPTGLAVMWDHVKGPPKNEMEEYQKLVASAFAKASADAGI